jgi:hypothetical protein
MPSRRIVVAFALAAAASLAGYAGLRSFASSEIIAGVDQLKVNNTQLAIFALEIDSCAGTEPMLAWECVNTLVINRAPELGVATTLTGLRHSLEKYPQLFEQNCHRNMHYLGEYAGETFGDVDAALAAGGPDCQFGYYHGVIEGYARVTAKLWDEINDLCGKLSDDPNTYVYGECTHSLGHAIVTRTEDRIPEGLERCRLLQRDPDISACATGIFMSWSNTLVKLLKEPGVTQADLDPKYHYPPVDAQWVLCPDFDDLMAGACALFFAETTIHDAEHLSAFRRWCHDTFTGREHVLYNCHAGVGRVSGGYEEFQNLGGWPGVVELCVSGGYEDRYIAACAELAYTTASGFLLDASMIRDVCAAWEGHRLRNEQCKQAELIFYSTVADAGPIRGT